MAQAPPTHDVEAYNLYLLGESLVSRQTKENTDRAIDYFQQAFARDKKLARAYAGLATAYEGYTALLGDPQADQLAKAERAAREALALDPNNVEARVALAGISGARDQWLELAAQDRAIQALRPDDGFVHVIIAAHLFVLGQLRASADEVDRAHAMAPVNPIITSAVASIRSLQGLDEEALRYANEAADLGYSKEALPLLEVYARAALHAGRYSEAANRQVAELDLTGPVKGRAGEVIKLVYAALSDPSKRTVALASRARLYPRQSRPVRNVGAVETQACMAASFSYVLLDANDTAYDLANQCLHETHVAWYATRLNLFSPELRPLPPGRAVSSIRNASGPHGLLPSIWAAG